MIKKNSASIRRVKEIKADTSRMDNGRYSPFVYYQSDEKITPKQMVKFAKNVPHCLFYVSCIEDNNKKLTKPHEGRVFWARYHVSEEDYPLYQVVVERPGYFVDSIYLENHQNQLKIYFSRINHDAYRYVSPVFTYVPNLEHPIRKVKLIANTWQWFSTRYPLLDTIKAMCDAPLFEDLTALKSSALLKLAHSWNWEERKIFDEKIKDNEILCREENVKFIFSDAYSNYGGNPYQFNAKKDYSLGIDFVSLQDGKYVLQHLDIKNKTTKPTDPDFENSPIELNLQEVARFDNFCEVDRNTIVLSNDGAKNYEDYAVYQGGKRVTDIATVKNMLVDWVFSKDLPRDLFVDAKDICKNCFPFFTKAEFLGCFLAGIEKRKENGKRYHYDINNVIEFCKDDSILFNKMLNSYMFTTRIFVDLVEGELKQNSENAILHNENPEVLRILKKQFVKAIQNSAFIKKLREKCDKEMKALREFEQNAAVVVQNKDAIDQLLAGERKARQEKMLKFLDGFGVKCIADNSESLVHTFDENYPILLKYDRYNPIDDFEIYLLDEIGTQKDLIAFGVWVRVDGDYYGCMRYNERNDVSYYNIRHVGTFDIEDKVTILAQEVKLPSHWHDFFGTADDKCEFFYQVENAEGTKGYFVEDVVENELAEDGLKIPRKIETDFRTTQGDLVKAYHDFKNDLLEIGRLEDEFFAEEFEYERQLAEHESKVIEQLPDDDDDEEGGNDGGEGEEELPF